MAKSDFEVASTVIPAGTMISVSLGAANVYLAEFPDAHEVRFHQSLGSRELRVTLSLAKRVASPHSGVHGQAWP
jgi:cytochrome P450